MFEVGKKVVSLSNFDAERELYDFNYPYKGDVWVVVGISKHPVSKYISLHFNECQIPLCSKNFAPVEEIGDTLIEELFQPEPEHVGI